MAFLLSLFPSLSPRVWNLKNLNRPALCNIFKKMDSLKLSQDSQLRTKLKLEIWARLLLQK